jgi:hypothetical protein
MVFLLEIGLDLCAVTVAYRALVEKQFHDDAHEPVVRAGGHAELVGGDHRGLGEQLAAQGDERKVLAVLDGERTEHRQVGGNHGLRRTGEIGFVERDAIAADGNGHGEFAGISDDIPPERLLEEETPAARLPREAAPEHEERKIPPVDLGALHGEEIAVGKLEAGLAAENICHENGSPVAIGLDERGNAGLAVGPRDDAVAAAAAEGDALIRTEPKEEIADRRSRHKRGDRNRAGA